MAKKYKSTKLLKQQIAATQKPASAFGKFANRLADAKKKKIQKLTDTQKRLLESKKNNKMIKISKKAKKFALLDEDDPSGHGAQGLGLTHKGINVKDLKQFDDVAFNESDLQNDEQFDNLQQKINFAGFQATQNLVQQQARQQDKRPKTQNEIYKQIIQKSKAYKMFRQQQYEQNFNKANELDQGFDKLVSQLKFRNKDQQMLQRIQNRDSQYDKLMNELKEDERIVSNKIVQKNEKYTEKIRKKKNDQLNKLMKDSDGEDQDIRGWVDDEAEDEEEEHNQLDNQQGDEDQQGDQDNEQDEQEQGSYDELDDVNLSSEEQQNQEQGEENDLQDEDQQGNDQQNQEDLYGDQQDEELQGQIYQDEQDQDDQVDEDQDDDDQQDQQQEEQEQSTPPPPKYNKNNKNQPAQNNNQKSNNTPQSKNNQAQNINNSKNPKKKVKLNFVQ